MRVVWASTAFVAGVASAIVFGLAPEHAVPTSVFLLVSVAVALGTLSLLLTRRRAAVLLLCGLFLIGCWRGGDAIASHEQIDRSTPLSSDHAAPDDVSPLGHLRFNIAKSLTENIGSDHSGLPIALLTGDRSSISPGVTDDFRSAGMAHLLAISGLHVSLVGGGVMAFAALAFGRRRHLHLLLPLATVLVYAALAGFAPPITRATIMFSMFVLGIFLGRGSSTLAALALAAMLMIAFDPAILTSLSFQLSFAAMLGISFVVPALSSIGELAAVERLPNERNTLLSRVKRFAVGSLAVSIASTLGTLPLIALHFDAVPIWGPLATLVAVPAMPVLITLSAFLAGFGAVPMPFLPEIAAIPAVAATQYLTFVAGFFAELPPQPVETGGWSVWMTVFYYSVAGIVIAFWSRIAEGTSRLRLRFLNPGTGFVSATNRSVGIYLTITTLLLLIAVGAWSLALIRSESPSHLSVKFLQTTHGESILIETRNGNRMLVDTGGERWQVADTLNSILPLWDRDIDIVLLTHPDSDHVGGLAGVLSRFRVDTVIHSETSGSNETPSTLSSLLEGEENVVTARNGMLIGLDEDVFVEVLSAGCVDPTNGCSNDNDDSIVTMLHTGDVSFLLTGDIERATEIRLAASGLILRATVLKAAHHGSNTSSTSTFIDAVEPSAVVVASGTQNRYGHPHPEVMERLNRAVGEERVFRTDLMGTVELRTDGQGLWMVRQD